jgi:hypothetical protein
VRYKSKLFHAPVMANNGLKIGNLIGVNIDTQSWQVKYLTLDLSWEAAHALDIAYFRYPGGVHYSPACLPVSLIATYDRGIVKIDRNLGQLGCKNGIIECLPNL